MGIEQCCGERRQRAFIAAGQHHGVTVADQFASDGTANTAGSAGQEKATDGVGHGRCSSEMVAKMSPYRR